MSYDSRPDTYEHIGKVRGYLGDAIKILLDRADRHDASKLVAPEREAFDVPGRPEAPQYDDDFLRSIVLNQERFGYGDELRQILENTARALGFAS